MPKNQLKVVGVQIRYPSPQARASGGLDAWLDLSVEVENPGTSTLHVWAAHGGYDFDAASGVLSVHLAEVPLKLPPNIKMLSDHPRTPPQIEVPGASSAKIRVRFPAHVRRAAEDGDGWREYPIADIKQVEIDVQSGPDPVEPMRPHEASAGFRKRLLDYGAVTHATITPTIVD